MCETFEPLSDEKREEAVEIALHAMATLGIEGDAGAWRREYEYLLQWNAVTVAGEKRIKELEEEVAEFMKQNHGHTDVEFWQKRYYERRTQVFELREKANTSIMEDIHGVSEMVADKNKRIKTLEDERHRLRVMLRIEDDPEVEL